MKPTVTLQISLFRNDSDHQQGETDLNPDLLKDEL